MDTPNARNSATADTRRVDRDKDIATWWASVQGKRAMRQARALFEGVGGSEKDNHITINRIVVACFNAARYNPARDPGQQYRAKMSRARSEVLTLAQAAHTLAMGPSSFRVEANIHNAG